MLLMAGGYGWFIVAADRVEFFSVLSIGALIGVGMGMVSITSMVAVQNTAPRDQLGAATSTVMLARMLGGAFGIALMGSVLVARMERRLMDVSSGAFADLSEGLLKKLANPQNLLDPATRALIPESVRAFLVEILAGSVRHAFFAGFFVMVVGLVVSFFMSSSTPAVTHGEKHRG
jgi:hypothetical protein